ncbi:DUF5681 domain-containing protein [Desertibaculum subflavum]|uniref:DUF5681 domain-containing protein n=1 Tax=Desertibaculum subflavum TaxID=2268458 RepID=UPI000E666470
MSDYKVGYRKPPKATRFRKGKSGNPKGRPKGSRNLLTIVADELTERITVKENGKARRITKAEAMVKQLLARAMGGDTRAAFTIMKLSQERQGEEAEKELDSDDRKILDAYFARRNRRPE